MKTRLSLLVLSVFAISIVAGCSGVSEEQAKNVDLKAVPKNAPLKGGGQGTEAKPGPGNQAKPI